MVVVTLCTPPTEGIRHEQPATVAVMNKKEMGKGTIYIAESCLSWVNGRTGKGFNLQYPHICVHAVSRDTSAYPKECLYLMIDTDIDFSGQENGSEDEEEEEDEAKMTEIRFIPEDNTCLDSMYSAMNDCQALHPDPQQDSSEEEEHVGPVGPGGDHNEDDDDDDEAFMDADDECLNRNGARNFEMEVEGQFDNADDVDAGYEED